MSDFSKTRNFGLDIVRALAITFVLISHARQVLVYPEKALLVTFGGWFGVELFFALSGFLIGTILIKLFETGVTAKSLGRFWFRRWMRTLPAYFFVLIFFWAVFGRVQFSDFVLLQWPINSNLGVVPVSWSLAIEEWFYILFPIAALAATAMFKGRGIPITIVAAIIIPLLVRFYQHYSGVHPVAIRANPFRFDGMAFGVLIAYLLQMPNFRNAMIKSWPLLAAAAIALFSLDLVRYSGDVLRLPILTLPRWYHDVASYVVTGIAAALIVLTLYLRAPRFGGVVDRGIVYVSKVSYSLYLWHMLFFSYMAKFFPEYHGIGLYVIAIFSAMALSFVPYVLIETPFLKMRDYFSERGEQTAQPVRRA